MSEENFTPGPWVVDEGAEGFPIVINIVINEDCGEVVGDEGFFSDIGRDYANANLIAAAPELYDALADALCALEVCGRDFDYVMDKTRNALAKARGK